MEFNIDAATLEVLWEALSEEPGLSKLAKAERIYHKIAKAGWAFPDEIEDILYLLDSRLVHYQLNLKVFSEALEIKWEYVYYRPGALSKQAQGSHALRTEQAALFLMTLKRIGFQVDASPLVKLLLPPLKSKKKKLLAGAELSVFWFERLRHRQYALDIGLASEEHSWRYIKTEKRVKTPSGYEICFQVGKDGSPAALKVTAPKYRKQAH